MTKGGQDGSHLTVGINADEQLIFHVTGSGGTRGLLKMVVQLIFIIELVH